MLDLRWIRDNPDALDGGLAKRGNAPMAREILALDSRHRAGLTGLQELQARRNATSKAIGAAKARGQDAGPLIAEVAALKSTFKAAEEETRKLAAQLEALLAGLPNPPADEVPEGADESANVELRRWGDKPTFDFEPRPHYEIGEGLGLMDFEAAARMSGSRFVVLKGALARLERALGAFMLDLHTREGGYCEVSPPLLVRDGAVFGTGQLPKFADDLFATTNGHWLIPTAEVPLANLVREQILDQGDLPLRYVALTPCFRSEAGAAGKDTRGMIRQHQFTKVEMVSICDHDGAGDELARMTAGAEEVLKRLGLPYRVVMLCGGDMGFSAQRTYDIEVWLPAQDTYREISSLSDCGDFQARRMGARYRSNDGGGTRFVHSFNGSGLALGRTLVAVLENYQRGDGSVAIPEVLRPYMDGIEVISGNE